MSVATGKHSRTARRTPAAAAFAAMLAAFCVCAPVESAAAGQGSLLRVSANEYGATQRVTVGMNKSVLIDLPADVKEVVVSQPAIAGAIMRSKRRAFIQGTGAGETNVFFLDANGDRIAVLDISVVHDATGLQASLASLLPGSQIRVASFGDRVVLSGSALSADDVQKAAAIAAQFTGDPAAVANLINSSGQQVMLKVTVAEVSRETIKQLGINLNASWGNGAFSTGIITSPPIDVPMGNVFGGNGATVGIDVGAFSLDATLRALERRGALRTLAEPTLTALSGQEADFHVGGEFPVPVGYEDGKVTIEFKEFGVKLKFTPQVKSHGVIGLNVDTTVSELSVEGSQTIAGITIPGTKERHAKTSVELGSGSTLAIAGLIEERTRQQINSVPGLGNIPILGALFRSREFVRSETELMILVTPYIAQATTADVVLPTDEFAPAGDAEAIFLGHMEKLYGVGGPDGGLRGGYQGSVGFVLD